MFTTRPATIGDVEIITHHRHRMFVDMGRPDDDSLRTVIANFRPWITRKLQNNEYLGWFATQQDRVVAGAGLMLIDFPPNIKDPSTTRAYLLNFYVEPEFRGHRLGRTLLDCAMEETRHRHIGVVTLHASTLGRPLYEAFGFEQSNEMMFRNKFD
jgi:ribosomal protein S18 acetylase RimI-like enzyme